MDALFVNGPFLPGFSRESRSPAVTKSGTLYYPGWLAYACGYLESKGLICELIDCIADKLSFEQSVERVIKHQPKVIFIGTSTPSIEDDAKFAKVLKDRLGTVVICMVGTHAGSTPVETLMNYSWIDLIARREYDITALELVECVLAGKDWSKLEGISFRQGVDVVNNSDRPYIEDLDDLPFVSEVYKKHLTIENYYYGHVKYPMVSIFTSRGCNAKCSYCLYPQTMFGKFRSRSPQSIAAEFSWITKNLPQVKEVLVDDDTFTMKHEHAREVARELIKLGNTLPWTCEVRASLDFETLKLMKQAGCRLVVVGFESVDQAVLDNVKKGINQSKVDDFVDAAHRARIKIHACFMAGNPGDTMETLERSLNWAILKNFDTSQFFPLQLYPGTAAYKDAKDEGRLKQQQYRMWVTPAGMHNMTLIKNNKGLSEKEVLDFCDYARQRFYLRPRYILRKSMDIFLDFDEFRKNVKGFLNIRKHLFRKVSKNLI